MRYAFGLLGVWLGLSTSAYGKTASFVANANVSATFSSQGCQNQPSCPQCNGFSCSRHGGFCQTSYIPFPNSPFEHAFVPLQRSHSDQACNNFGVSCSGGKTTCKVDYLPVVDGDDYIAKFSPEKYLQNSNSIACNYFHADCTDCCAQWSGSCYNYNTCYDTSCDNSNPPVCTQVNPHNCC